MLPVFVTCAISGVIVMAYAFVLLLPILPASIVGPG